MKPEEIKTYLVIDRLAAETELVGSRVTCNPPPTNTDQDILVLCYNREHRDQIQKVLENDFGYYSQGDEDYFGSDIEEYGFISLKSYDEDVNYILTDSNSFYLDFLNATKVAKQENILDKEERKALFQKMLYNLDQDTFSSSIFD